MKIRYILVTTLRPQIGTIEYRDHRQITVADLPGLIEGAHANIGLGHKFLKHIERTKLLLMVVDLFGFKLSAVHRLRTCIQNIFALNKELELYDEELLDRPCILLLNKIDEDGAQSEYDQIKEKILDLKCKCDGSFGIRIFGCRRLNLTFFWFSLAHTNDCPDELISNRFIQFDDIHVISAKDEIGIDNVKTSIRDTLDKYAELKIDDAKNALPPNRKHIAEKTN